MKSGCVYLRDGNLLLQLVEQDIPQPIRPLLNSFSLDHPLVQSLLLQDAPGRIHDIISDVKKMIPQSEAKSMVCMVLKTDTELIGFMVLAAYTESMPDPPGKQALKIIMHEARLFFERIQHQQERIRMYDDLEQRVVQRTSDLQARINELHGIHGYAKLLEQPDSTCTKTAAALPQLICESLRRPELACCRIVLEDSAFESSPSAVTACSFSTAIMLHNHVFGNIEVSYQTPNSLPADQPFLESEIRMVQTIAHRLALSRVREKTEAALRRSEHQYRNLFYQLNDAAILFDASSRKIIDANTAAGHLFEKLPSALKALTISDLFPQEPVGETQADISQLLVSGSSNGQEISLTTKNHIPVSVTLSSSSITIDGRPCIAALFHDVTAQKRAELQRELLNSVFRLFAEDSDLPHILQRLVSTITDKIPKTDLYFTEYDANHNNIRIAAASNRFVCIDPQGVSPQSTSFTTLAIREKKPLWFSDLQQHPEFAAFYLFKKRVHSLLAVPVMAHGKPIGAMLLFSTQPNINLQPLSELLLSIAHTTASEIDRKNSEQLIRRHDQILSAINFAGAALIKEKLSNVVISSVLGQLGSATQVSRVYIFSNFTDQTGDLFCAQQYEWCNDSTEPQQDIPELQHVCYATDCPRWERLLAAQKPIVGNVCDFPAQERAALEPQHILSLCVVPIFVDYEWWGFLGFDDCVNERTWTTMETDALQTAAEVIGSSIARNNSERALRHSEEQFRIIFDKSLDIILIIDPASGKILRANDTVFRSLGYEPQQLTGETLEFLLPFAGRSQFMNFIAQDSGKTIFRTQQFIRFDGGLCTMDFTAAPIPWGQQNAILATLRDVTEREIAEDVLKRNELKYRRIFEESPASLWQRDYSKVLIYLDKLKQRGVLDLSTYFSKNPTELRWCMRLIISTDANRTSRELFNAPTKDDLLRSTSAIYDAHSYPFFIQELCALANHQVDLNMEYHHCTLDGKPLTLIMRWSVLPGCENTFKRVLVSYINITSQRSAEREAALRRDQLVRAEKMVSLGTLVTGVAHEINNPNSFVTLNAPLVLDAWQKSLPILNLHAQQQGDFDLGIGSYLEMREEIQTLIEDMIESGNRIRTIVNALRDFARSTPAKAFSAISINDVVHSTATLLRTTIQKHTRNFSIQYGSDIPPVQANLQKLEQVLMNLTRNACEALDTNSQSIIVHTAFDEDNQTVCICVEDQGCGIPESLLPQIVDPFYTTKRDRGHTGLGLSISATIMEEHGGHLKFTSTPGCGTTAMMILPLADPTTLQVETAAPASAE